MKHSILVVDDDRLILNTLKERFSGWEFEVFAAHSPSEAKQILASLTPDVVLLDLLLTADDGSQEILDYLKSQERLANVPVLVLTNMDKPELREMMLKQGVKEYLIKGSLSLDEIYKKVAVYLEPPK